MSGNVCFNNGALWRPLGHVIPPEKVHEKLFVGSEKQFKKPSYPAVARYNKKRTAEQVDQMRNKLMRKEWKLRKRLAAHGINYDFPGFVSQDCLFSAKSSSQHPLSFQISTTQTVITVRCYIITGEKTWFRFVFSFSFDNTETVAGTLSLNQDFNICV